MNRATTQAVPLSTLSLKEIAALVNMPSIAKMSKDKAVARAEKILADRTAEAVKKLEAMLAPEPRIDARAQTPKVDAGKPAKAPRAPKADKPVDASATAKPAKVNKHACLVDALRDGGTREELMTQSQFDNKNLSVALCNLKRAGYIIGIEEREVEGVKTRFYQLVDEKRTTAH